MKKRLLLIFVIGISFSPSVFAVNTGLPSFVGTDGTGPFNHASNGQMIFCETLGMWVPKAGSNAQATTQDAGVTAGAMTLQDVPAPSGG